MKDKHERLLNLDNSKLMDVVKNYRQYGFDEEFRESAISILEERGISKEDLQISGNFENKTYDFAQLIFRVFQKNSTMAFAMYLVLLVFAFIAPLIPENAESLAIFIIVGQLVALIAYVIFLIKSFMNQNEFYNLTGKDYGAEGALLYFFFGMPFYLFMFFYFRNQMKERIDEIQ